MMTRLLNLLIVAGLLFQGSALAEPETYEIDASHTHVQFSVDRFGFNAVIGEFEQLKGVLFLDEERAENSSVQVEIETASLESGDPLRNEHVSGEFWFDVKNYPVIRFVSKNIELTGEHTARITGDLTIKEVTREVVLEARLNKIGIDPATKKKAAGFSATAQLQRADFGISIADKLIGADVEIRIELLAHQKEQAAGDI